MKPPARPSAGIGDSPGARHTLVRFVVVPSWVIVGALVLAFVAGFEVSGPLRYAPFALSMVFFGLPHGAVDHLVPGRLFEKPGPTGSVVFMVLLYVVLAAVYLALWAFSPVAAFSFFILLTWFHWGQGDLYSTVTFLRAQHLAPRALKILYVAVRGGLPMLVPLLSFPTVYGNVAESTVGLFSNVQVPAGIFGPGFRLTAGIAFLALVLVTLTWGFVVSGPRDKSAWMLDAAETGLLMAYFAVVPPVFALGMYFCLWHAPRHIARLMLLNPNLRPPCRRGLCPVHRGSLSARPRR